MIGGILITKQIEFLVKESKLNSIKKFILDNMNSPILVPRYRNPDNRYKLIKNPNELNFKYLKLLNEDYFSKSGAYWSVLLSDEKFFIDFSYNHNQYLDYSILDIRQSPVFEFSPCIFNDQVAFKGRIALFYEGENKEFITLYNRISDHIKKFSKSD